MRHLPRKGAGSSAKRGGLGGGGGDHNVAFGQQGVRVGAGLDGKRLGGHHGLQLPAEGPQVLAAVVVQVDGADGPHLAQEGQLMEPLNPTAHQAGGGGILPGQVFGGQAADGPGAQGGEGVPLQQGHRLAGVPLAEQDGAVKGGEPPAGIVRAGGEELGGSIPPGEAGHGGQGGGPLGQRRPVCHGAPALGKEEEGLLHSGYHLLVGEGLADVGRVEIAHEGTSVSRKGCSSAAPSTMFFL